MIIFKRLTIPFYLIFILNFIGPINSSVPYYFNNLEVYQKVDLIDNYQSFNKSKLIDCTVKIVADGMELEVTFHDVSRFRCALIKIGKWFQDTF